MQEKKKKLIRRSFLFSLTSAMSFYAVAYYKRTGTMPGYQGVSDPALIEAQTKDAFSTAPQDDQEDYGSSHGSRPDDQYAPIHAYEVEDTNRPAKAVSWEQGNPNSRNGYDTSYAGAYSETHPPPHQDYGENPFNDDENGRTYRKDGFDHDDEQSYYGVGRR